MPGTFRVEVTTAVKKGPTVAQVDLTVTVTSEGGYKGAVAMTYTYGELEPPGSQTPSIAPGAATLNVPQDGFVTDDVTVTFNTGQSILFTATGTDDPLSDSDSVPVP